MPGTAVCTLSIGNSRPQWELLAPGERAIQFSRSGRFLLTSAKNRIRLRDTRDWSVAEEISHRGAGVSGPSFHLTDATLLTPPTRPMSFVLQLCPTLIQLIPGRADKFRKNIEPRSVCGSDSQ
jgi:hypothetical protein